MTEFSASLAQSASAIEDEIGRLLPTTGPVVAPMRYAVLNGGKRLRGFLVLASADLFAVPRAQSLRAAAAIECMHAYSLVHDDLPAMDDDTLRRGQPTVHVKWDEATGILTGDALQAQAFEILAAAETCPSTTARLALVQSLAQAAGADGMVSGQALDLAAETSTAPLTVDQIETLQAQKTGALFRWSATAGAVMAQEDTRALAAYADDLGLAFQIWDDVLDEIGEEATLGKRVRKDAVAGKATFVSLLGLDRAKARAKSLVTRACDRLAPYGKQAATLQALAQFVIAREK